MAVFKYTAVTPEGQQVKSTIDGVSVTSAENDLIRQNLRVVKIREKKGFSEIEVSPEREATTVGAAHAAGLAVGAWAGDDDIAATWRPAEVVEPVGSFDRERWADTLARAERWFPDLSAISF